MTIKELDDKLNSSGFQDTENGDLFYNFFIYQYPAEEEYDIRRQIQEFKANLIRPINYVDVLTLNLLRSLQFSQPEEVPASSVHAEIPVGERAKRSVQGTEHPGHTCS